MRSISTVLLVVATLATLSFTAPAEWALSAADEFPEILGVTESLGEYTMEVIDELASRNIDLEVGLDF
ncbi:hypothetical protein C0989_006754 [Termitomyces sp. Mn162]|nr:hypothetical protein C0989_006754 [Termitomyces sp. Mn162]KAH0589786.1 hypothetical protein H2248_005501 [Termitomyces sp. 'cryptogamus']